MVSLQPNSMNTGAQYMDEVTSDSNTVNINDDEPILSSTSNQDFEKLRTIPAAVIIILITTAISCVCIAFHVIWQNNESVFIITTLRAAFWIITHLLDSTMQKHHNKLRMNGYHDFHRSITNKYNGKAIMIVSAINTIVMLYLSSIHSNEVKHLMILVIQIVETLILYVVNGMYISCVRQFNNDRHFPDALEGTNSSPGSLGLIQPGGNVAELVEKQADLIAYLKDHNQKLRERLYQRGHEH